MTAILQYNWRFYLLSVAGLAAGSLVALHAPPPASALLLAAVAPGLFWICSSLAVSHYVYDRSPLYEFRWLSGALSQPPSHWVNIHAGLDETTPALRSLFPAAQGEVLDIYDPTEMTEPSIAEARLRASGQVPPTPADFRNLPLPDNAFDAIFLIFTAHELRRPESRAQLFREVARLLDRHGELVLVEHLRDWRNFLAFGPGFLHFFPRTAWRRAANAAGLVARKEFNVTPFVSVSVLRRPS